jgi:DNA-binding transcriptional regulator YhcF (GntR family)
LNVRIDKNCEVSICKQLSEQIVFLIATGRLKAGDALPSVRQMALRHKIHANTVSEAYKDLVQRHWLKRHRGKKMVVRPFDNVDHSVEDLDDLIDDTIRTALDRGYTLQELRKRVRERLLIVPPDHVLIIEDEPGMQRLLRQELSEMLPLLTIEATSPDKLAKNPDPVIGALVVTLPGRVWNLVAGNPPLLPRGHPLLAVELSGVDAHLGYIRELPEASVIGVASISQEFLRLARAVLAPFVGSRHAMEEHLLNGKETKNLFGMDLVFCDTAARRSIKARRIVSYHVISSATAQNISDRIASSRD